MAHQLRPENSLLAHVLQSQERWVIIEDGQPYCLLCQKKGPGHIKSKRHIFRVEEDAIATVMAGNAQSTRRFSGGNGCPGPATKKALLDHYGEGLMSLPAEAAKCHESRSMWLINKVEIKRADVVGYELGIVSYNGKGKYGKPGELTSNRLVPFDELPDSDEVITDATPAPSPPDGQGWWPVISMELSEEGMRRITKVKKDGVLIICFYQLIAGRLVCWQLIMPIEDDGLADGDAMHD